MSKEPCVLMNRYLIHAECGSAIINEKAIQPFFMQMKTKYQITHLQNFIHEVAVGLSHNMSKAFIHTGLVLGSRLLTHPALAIEFEPKDLVLGVFNYLIAPLHQFVYGTPFYFGAKVFLQNWQKMPPWTFSVATQRSILFHWNILKFINNL